MLTTVFFDFEYSLPAEFNSAGQPLSSLDALLISWRCSASAGGARAADGVSRAVNEIGGDGRPLSLSRQILVLMSLLTVLPSLLLMMTSFTRIIIVLSILRHALGLQQTPPNQVLVGLSLFLSLFVMAPVISEVNRVAITPYGEEQIDIGTAVSRSGDALHGFMMKQTRKTDLMMFAKIAKAPSYASPKDVPFSILLPAFVTSELKTAFISEERPLGQTCVS